MAYELDVVRGGLWLNYLAEIQAVSCYDAYDIAVEKLSQFNARNVHGTSYLEFDTEEDATYFALRYG